jgi:hypothetical protein
MKYVPMIPRHMSLCEMYTKKQSVSTMFYGTTLVRSQAISVQQLCIYSMPNRFLTGTIYI